MHNKNSTYKNNPEQTVNLSGLLHNCMHSALYILH